MEDTSRVNRKDITKDFKGKGKKMNVYEINEIDKLISPNPYVGRGIVIGKTPDGKKACIAYFIMGRSANSRNRIFEERDGAVYTKAFDESKVEDPSLIIYAAIKKVAGSLVVTNGDQTDTIVDGRKSGISFSAALSKREFEPDKPNFTPRISGIMNFYNSNFNYEMSILKSADSLGTACNRYTFSYASIAGLGHFIHTYEGDGNPLPTFLGEPKRVRMYNDIDEFTDILWNSLNQENKISLYVRYIDLQTGEEENRLINKNEQEN